MERQGVTILRGNVGGAVEVPRSLFFPREREQGPASIRWESLAEIEGNCSLDQKDCFSELYVFLKANFQLLFIVWSSSCHLHYKLSSKLKLG